MAIRTQKRILPVPILSLDTSKPGSLIDNRATPDCQNTRVERSQIKKKEGYNALGTASTGDIVCLGEFDRQGKRYFFRISTRKFEWWNAAGTVWKDYTGGNLTGVTTHPVSVSTAKIGGKNILVFTNYVDAIQKWVGGENIAVLGGSPPKAKFLLGFNRYLLLASIKSGASIYPERVQWSDYDDPEQWTEATDNNAGYFDLDDGYTITGMFRLGNTAVVPKTDSIWLGYLTGDDRVFHFEAIERKLGFLVGNTIKVIPGGIALGLSKHGIVEFNGLRAKLIAPGIFEDIRDYVNASLVYLSFAEVIAELNEYWLFIPITGQSYPTRLYRYNYITGQVYKDLVRNLTAIGLRTPISGTLIDDMPNLIDSYTDTFDSTISREYYPYIILGDKDSKTYQFDYDETNENNEAIDAYWCSKDVIPYPGYYAHWTRLFFEGLGDTVTISYSTDEGSTYTELETITLTSSMATYVVYCDIFSEKLRLKVANSETGETFTMRNLYYQPPIQREAIER